MSAATLSPAISTLETARWHHSQGQLLAAAEAYRSHLAADPKSQPALLGLSLIARQSSQLQPALHMAQAALAAGAANALAWSNLGDILTAQHQHIQAEAIFRHALTLDPGLAAAHYGLGNALALQDNFPAALPSFQSAARLAPNIPAFHFALAFAQGKLAAHAAAITAYRRAVTLRPSFASAWLNLGVELIADGRSSLAAPCYRQALAASQQNSSTSISAYLNLGHLVRSRSNFLKARQHYESALTLAEQALANQALESPAPPNLSRPDKEDRRTEVHVAFTYLHLEQKHFPQAWQSLLQAESHDDPLHPNPEIPNVRGILLLAEDSAEPNGVAQVSKSGVPDDRSSSSAWLRLGFPNILKSGCPILGAPLRQGWDGKNDRIKSAITAFHQAEFHGHKTAASNRGNALLRLGRCEEALAAHQAAVDRDPHHPGARYNLALTQLRLGNFAHGWPNYEIRWSFREVHPHPRRLPQPRWQGEPLPANSRLFLYAEQGLGDTIQFCRYLTLVAQRLTNTNLILEIQPPLTRLLTTLAADIQSTHPGLTIEILSQGDPLPSLTHHCPLMSLPAVFQTTLDTVPAQIPYLRADPVLIETRTKELRGAPSLPRSLWQGWDQQISIPKIGIAWAGNPRYRADHERSTSLDAFRPLLAIPNIHWISLQKGDAAMQISVLPAHLRPEDGSSRDPDFAATAALVANLDLVITTDTAIAHLAGALGKPLWLLLPWQSDWRWMQDRLTTPWYPHARLFRQSSPGNWPELIQRVARELPAALTEMPEK
ncbi:MAG TPA: tetratricopeptide repeat protein [Acidobacteriaceae bacterium]|jgi:tetratricopeptide (TPR) repeat protein|nr:tetratricopeptide repeat protein [Acidobacteriaceae bacterium]